MRWAEEGMRFHEMAIVYRQADTYRALVAEIFDPATTYELELVTPADIVRALEIDAKFHQLKLGLVDGTVAAVAERRHVYRVLTIDHADFVPLRVGPRYRTPFEVVP
jgi:predicted nucleic acid-binding protein